MYVNFDRVLAHTLKEEGGYVNHPSDPGGRTNLGVTQKAWEAYVGHPVTEADMRALTPAIVEPFYRARYWNACRCDDLASGVDAIVFDIAVNSGPGRAAKFLQEAVGAFADGSIGPGTLAVAKSADPRLTINKIADHRESFYRALPTFPTFGKGWLARNERVRAEALSMV